jgi:hypothetical protein
VRPLVDTFLDELAGIFFTFFVVATFQRIFSDEVVPLDDGVKE